MIHLISILCSLCVQFGAVGLTPFNMLPLNTANESYIDTVKSQITGAKSRHWGSYSNYADVPNDYWIVVKGYNSSGGDIVCLCPNEYIDNSKTTTISCDAYTTGEDGVVSSAKLKFNQYTAFPVANNAYWIDSNANIYGWKTYNFLGGNWTLLYCNIPIYYNGDLIITLTDDVTVPEFPSFGGLGSFESGGHSSGGNPFDSLNNSVFNWASVTGHSNGGASGPSPHSSSTHFSSTTPSPNSNDSKTDSLLYMLGNKLADITENTSAIGDALGGIMYNQVSGASALFNAISGFNDNFVSAFTPPSKEEFSAVLQSSEIYASYQNVSSSVTAMTTTLNSVGQQSGYVWEISLPETWGGDLSFNFSSYFDTETLNFIRIIIGAILIISTIVFVAHQFPDIIGGGSGGENA